MTPPAPGHRRSAERPPEGLGGVAADVAERVKTMPGVDLVLGVIETWWARHPLRTVGLLPALAFRLARELPIDSWVKMYRSISVPPGTPPRDGSARASPPMDVPAPANMPPVASPRAVEREPSTIYP